MQIRWQKGACTKMHKCLVGFKLEDLCVTLKKIWLQIVLFNSLRNSKRRNKGNFMSKSNSNKIKLCGGGGQHYLVLNKISTL